jgi:hypothetical protein
MPIRKLLRRKLWFIIFDFFLNYFGDLFMYASIHIRNFS